MKLIALVFSAILVVGICCIAYARAHHPLALPQALRCKGFAYGNDWICCDSVLGYYDPSGNTPGIHSDPGCGDGRQLRNFIL